MASGDTLGVFTALNNMPPTTSHASIVSRNGRVLLAFDAAADEAAVFIGWLPANYAGGGLTVSVVWLSQDQTTGDVVWAAQIEHANTDIDADSFASAQTATGTANATNGISTTTNITFSSGANMDGLLAGEPYVLKIYRDADAAGDTMSNDAQLMLVVVKES